MRIIQTARGALSQARQKREPSGLSVSLGFTAPIEEAQQFEEVAAFLGISRAAFFYQTIQKEARRLLKARDRAQGAA